MLSYGFADPKRQRTLRPHSGDAFSQRTVELSLLPRGGKGKGALRHHSGLMMHSYFQETQETGA